MRVGEKVPSAEAQMDGQPDNISELYSKCSQIADKEARELSRIAGAIVPVLAWLSESVVLRPKSLGGVFAESRSVTLETGAKVVVVEAEGQVSSRQLSEFKTAECLAILNEAYPEIRRMAADKRRERQVRPVLSLKAIVGGAHLIFDTRTYRLAVANSGGDCVGLRFSLQLPSGASRSSRPCDVDRGMRAQVDLGAFKELAGQERLEVQLDCKDVDGRELRAEEKVSLRAGWTDIDLKRKG